MGGFSAARKLVRPHVDLKDLRRQPAANDNFEFDPTDVLTEVFSLGEAAPAALFLFPMWAAASAYLKDPQYYLNKHFVTCDEASSEEKRRPLEWQPLHKPMVPSRQDYRNPQLSEADRQKLVEWLRSEKTRGNFTGAEGQPKALPQDPPRDDAYGAPTEFRNGVMDVPRPNAMPLTEVALPDLQQTDDRRRLTLGDAIPGRERVLGDVLQDGALPHGARDFLAPQSEQATAQDESRGPAWLPDFRMGILGRGGKLPSGGARYSAQFREQLRGAGEPQQEAPLPPPSPVPQFAPAGPKRVDPKDRPRVQVELAAPQFDNLAEIEAVFKQLATLCPVDDRGMMDTSALRIGHDLTKGVEFKDGQVMTVQVLLKHHEVALRKWSEMQGKQPPELEGTYRSETRLLDVLRRVTGLKYLLSTTQAAIAQVIIKTEHRQLKFTAPNKKLAEVLRHAWENFEATQGKMSIHTMQTSMVESKGGERVRLQDLMALYWQGLHAQLKAKKLNVPEDRDYHATEDGLDLIYFSLFDRVRIRSRWAGSLKSVALPFTPHEPLPEVTTLQGALSVFYKLSQTSIMDGVDRFPVEPKGTLVVVYDPRSGRSFNYEKLMYAVHHMIAQAKADATTARVFTDVVVGPELLSQPDLARRRFPAEETRRSLLTFVRHHRGYPAVSIATHVRRRSGERLVVSTSTLAPDSTGSRRATVTEPYLAGDSGMLFPSAMLDRLVTRLTYADSLADVRDICNDMKARGLDEAVSVKQWVDGVVGTKAMPIQNALKGLPEQKRLAPIMLPLVFSDVYKRLQSLIASSSKVQRRWDAQWKSEKVDALDTLSRFDRIRDFVLDEEARLDASPQRGMLRSWRADSTQELGQPDPWLAVQVPPAFADAMARVLGAPEIRARAQDVSRAFMQLMPLDDVGAVHKARGIAETQDLLYTTLTGRPLEEWSEATLTPEQKQLREKMVLIGQTFGMIQFNDYWLGQGVKLANRDGSISPTLRIYLAINPKWAAEALKALNEIYVGWKPNEPRDVQFKMTNVPPELGRTDASLFYIDAANQGIFDRIVALQEVHPEYLRAVQGPPTTAQYLKDGQPTGISVAEAPRDVRDSRNGIMSQLATTALHLYRERLVRGQRLTQAEWIQIAAYYMQREGIDLERPGFYSGNADRQPGWVIFADIFRHTDQYNATRDEPLLQHAKPVRRSSHSHTTQVMGTARFAERSPLMSASWAEDPFTPDPARSIGFSKAVPGLTVHRMSDGINRPPSSVPSQPGSMRQTRNESSRLNLQARNSRVQMQRRPDSLRLPQERPAGALRLPFAILKAMQHPGVPDGKPEGYIPIGQEQRLREKKTGAEITLWRLDDNVMFKRSSNPKEGEDVMIFFEANELPGHPAWKLAIPLDTIRDLVRKPKNEMKITCQVKDKKYTLVIKAHKDAARRNVDLLTVTPDENDDIGAVIPWHPRWMTESILDTIVGVSK